jgi:hypothetical protein
MVFGTGQTSTPVPWDRNEPHRKTGRRRHDCRTHLERCARLQHKRGRPARSVHLTGPCHPRRRSDRATDTVHPPDRGRSHRWDRTCACKHPDGTSGHPPRIPRSSRYLRTASPRERNRDERTSPTRNCCHMLTRRDTDRRRRFHRAGSKPKGRSRLLQTSILCLLDRSRARERRKAHRRHSRGRRQCRIRNRKLIGRPCPPGAECPPFPCTAVGLPFRCRKCSLQNPRSRGSKGTRTTRQTGRARPSRRCDAQPPPHASPCQWYDRARHGCKRAPSTGRGSAPSPAARLARPKHEPLPWPRRDCRERVRNLPAEEAP